MAKSKARFLAELLSSDGKVIKAKSQASTIVVGDLPTIPNSKLANSSVTIAGSGLSLGASLTLDTADITEHTNYKYYTDARAITAVSGSDLDMSGRKVLFGNMYSSTGDLPSASTYHGMFAHVHGTGKGYFAHAGSWVELANQSGLTTATTTANAALPKAGGAMTGAITTNSTFDGRDVAADGVTADAALPKAGGAMTGAITTNSTFDGRDVATDGTKLDGVEASATADQTGAQIKALYEAETNAYTDTLNTKLNAIEASADVTDTANVTAAGALMDSELTAIASVKALNQGIATTDDPTFTNTKLGAIAASNTDTAVDVFVYDTRKDSDGGAWRKRTQNTSWYNEALNTSTRGARKEFPSVAVIVSTVNTATIYDGDDPSMPMWMVIAPNGIIDWATNVQTRINVSALNGILVTVTGDGGNLFKFVEDYVEIMYTNDNHRITSSRTIGGRNDTTAFITSADTAIRTYVVLTYAMNDVAMTVLPNAPIDYATGLPVPTIAVATNSGISIIKDNGSVVNITNTQDSSTFNFCQDVHFRSDGGIVWSADSTGNSAAPRFIHVLHEIPSKNFVHTVVANPSNTDEFYSRSNTAGDLRFPSSAGVKALQNSTGRTNVGTVAGLSNFAYNKIDPEKGLANYITSDYNTGYQVGDIKLAALSDTDTTNAVGTELVTNGTFTSNTSGWAGNATLSIDSNRLKVLGGYASQTLTTVVGKTYVINYTITNGNDAGGLYLGTGTGGTDPYSYFSTGKQGTGTYARTFIATTTTAYLRLYAWDGGTDFAFYDNVSVRLAEQDRSVNGNGLQVFGTVTKTAVATGADLVAYSGFSTSNYLHQPYNADLQFGTGDMSIAFWIKTSHTTNYKDIVARGDVGEGGWNASKVGSWFLQILSGSGNVRKLDFYYRHGSTLGFVRSTTVLPLNTWTQVVVQKIGTVMSYYFDGVFAGSGSITQTLSISSPDSTDKLRVGFQGSGYSFPCTTESLALLRVSATAPSLEQIKEMYNDEKHLFQTNAKATLRGTSDAVTALAYDDDTELLHVGTSAGRSEFQGLRRVHNTTDAVGTAISASNGFIVED